MIYLGHAPGEYVSDWVRLAEAIQQARLRRDWTQTELAEAANVSRPTVARIEAGQQVSLSTLSAVAAALGLRVAVQVQQIDGG